MQSNVYKTSENMPVSQRAICTTEERYCSEKQEILQNKKWPEEENTPPTSHTCNVDYFQNFHSISHSFPTFLSVSFQCPLRMLSSQWAGDVAPPEHFFLFKNILNFCKPQASDTLPFYEWVVHMLFLLCTIKLLPIYGNSIGE